MAVTVLFLFEYIGEYSSRGEKMFTSTELVIVSETGISGSTCSLTFPIDPETTGKDMRKASVGDIDPDAT